MRHLLAASFLVALAIAGCYVPASRQYQPTGKQRPDALIGDAKSSKPIKLNQTSLVEALPMLRDAINGSPDAPPVDLDDRFLLRTERRELAINFAVITGKWVTMSSASPTGVTRYLVLDFNPAGVITRSRTLDRLPADGDEAYHAFAMADGDRLFGSGGVKKLQANGTLMSEAQRGVLRRGGERKLRQQMELLRAELEAEHIAATQMAAEPATQATTKPANEVNEAP